MSQTAKQMQDEESQIPFLAEIAFGQARDEAIKRGYRVLYIQDGELREVEGGQQERVLRVGKSTIHARKGVRVQLKPLRERHV